MTDVSPINPAALPRNPAFSQGVSVSGGGRTIYVGGQNGIGVDGRVVGGRVSEQTAPGFLVEISAIAVVDAG